jgi:hypothetical protein
LSKRTARNPVFTSSGYETSVVRCAVAVLLVVVGIAWMVVYIHFAKDAALGILTADGKKPSNPLPWMADLKRWNYVIGFGLICIGLSVAAHKLTPLGRGRGVVVGMLFCFLFGLAWILVYYMVGDNITKIPVMKDLDQWNLAVGIAFMAVGFSYATKWE